MKCKYNERKTAKKEQADAIILTTLNHTKTYNKKICKQKRKKIIKCLFHNIFTIFFSGKVFKSILDTMLLKPEIYSETSY